MRARTPLRHRPGSGRVGPDTHPPRARLRASRAALRPVVGRRTSKVAAASTAAGLGACGTRRPLASEPGSVVQTSRSVPSRRPRAPRAATSAPPTTGPGAGGTRPPTRPRPACAVCASRSVPWLGPIAPKAAAASLSTGAAAARAGTARLRFDERKRRASSRCRRRALRRRRRLRQRPEPRRPVPARPGSVSMSGRARLRPVVGGERSESCGGFAVDRSRGGPCRPARAPFRESALALRPVTPAWRFESRRLPGPPFVGTSTGAIELPAAADPAATAARRRRGG